MTPEMDTVRLVARGDDAGSCESANRALLDACDNGIVRNVSVMMPGTAFADAVRLFAGRPDICLGLHVTLNAEWDAVKWGPVLPASQAPSLVDGNGHFLPTPRDLGERGFDADEVMAEVQAQLDKARQHGLNLAYMDEHMGVAGLPGLRARFAALAAREGLVYRPDLSRLPDGEAKTGDRAANWAARLLAAPPGTYLLVTHPGYDAPDMQALGHAGLGAGEVAADRDTDRRALTDARLRQACRERPVELIRYVDV